MELTWQTSHPEEPSAREVDHKIEVVFGQSLKTKFCIGSS